MLGQQQVADGNQRLRIGRMVVDLLAAIVEIDAGIIGDICLGNFPENLCRGHPQAGGQACRTLEDVIVFHAGTKEVDGAIVTNGGRVLNICALGKDLDETRAKVYKASEIIDFDGKYFRTDIGLM